MTRSLGTKPGTVIGTIRATDPSLPSILFTAHMDHVSPGDLARWAYDPYGGESADGWIHGRGASDTKGAIATQVHLPTALAGRDLPHGDLHVAQVVIEEVAGLGSTDPPRPPAPRLCSHGRGDEQRALQRKPRPHAGEDAVRRRERPREQSRAATRSRHYRAAAFLLALADLPMKQGVMGSSSAVPTRCATNLPDENVTPQSLDLSVDWRSVPGETPGRDSGTPCARFLATATRHGFPPSSCRRTPAGRIISATPNRRTGLPPRTPLSSACSRRSAPTGIGTSQSVRGDSPPIAGCSPNAGFRSWAFRRAKRSMRTHQYRPDFDRADARSLGGLPGPRPSHLPPSSTNLA